MVTQEEKTRILQNIALCASLGTYARKEEPYDTRGEGVNAVWTPSNITRVVLIAETPGKISQPLHWKI